MDQLYDLEYYKNQLDFYKTTLKGSIEYAKRIQAAIMPSNEELTKILPLIFILYKPRDIVSGDFYWLSKKDKHKVIIAATDCTGHGIPGAFMSMLGVSFLNEIVNTNRIYKPSEILNSLRENVIKTLRQTGKEGEAQDSMDIALITINEENKTVEFAGAYNSLYLIRSKGKMFDNTSEIEITNSYIESTDKYSLIEIKADRMPTGINLKYGEFQKNLFDYPLKRKLFLTKLRENYPFKNNIIKYYENDTLYLFSDGYIDQFGGSEGKRLKSNGFKKLLLSIQDRSMMEQCNILNSKFLEWKGGLDQVDDILIIGIKL